MEYDCGKTAKCVQDLINRFNEVPDREGYHSIFNNFLNFNSIVKILYTWIILQFKVLRIRNLSNIFKPKDCSMNPWHFLRDNWMDSFHGSHSIGSLIAIEQCDCVMKLLPKQKAGFYICENQNWEKALIHSWNKYDHGILYGVPHATIRFWDLRFSVDNRFLSKRLDDSGYFPHKYIMNGNAAYNQFLNGGFPESMLEKGEALRYEYLLKSKRLNPERHLPTNSIKILLLGDYIKEETVSMLKLLSQCTFTSKSEIEFVLKPHPKSPIDPNMFPQLKLTIENRSFDEIQFNFTICISTNMTSASVDAYLNGCNVIIMHSFNSLNLSALRGFRDVQFFRSSRELDDILSSLSNYSSMNFKRKGFFYLNKEHNMWVKIINKAFLN